MGVDRGVRARQLPDISILGPGRFSPILCVVDTRSWVPITSLTVIRTWSPARHSTGPAANWPSRIFGPLQVRGDSYGAPGAGGGLADGPVHPLVVAPVAVTEVQPGNVHAGLDQLGNLLRARSRGPEGANYLRAGGLQTPIRAARYPASCHLPASEPAMLPATTSQPRHAGATHRPDRRRDGLGAC
jgi:hypothetical protein